MSGTTNETVDEMKKSTAKFNETPEGQAFIISGASRETSPEIMESIAFFARDASEAEDLWNGDGFGRICNPIDLWESVTGNGHRASTDFVWGEAGRAWWHNIEMSLAQ